MPTKTTAAQYEWYLETGDGFGNVQDHRHTEKLSEIWKDKDASHIIVLVRDDWSGRLLVRSWAYLIEKDGRYKLPQYFKDAGGNRTNKKVPQPFHDELNRLVSDK